MHSPQPSLLSPETMTEDQRRILRLLACHSSDPDITPPMQANLADLGLDSLRFLMVLLEIEDLLGRRFLDMKNVGSLRTVADVIRLATVAPAQ